MYLQTYLNSIIIEVKNLLRVLCLIVEYVVRGQYNSKLENVVAGQYSMGQYNSILETRHCWSVQQGPIQCNTMNTSLLVSIAGANTVQHWKHVIVGQYSKGQYSATLETLIHISQCSILGPGLITASHRRMLERSGLISSCNPGWLRSTPCHNRRPGGCLLGVDRLVHDTTAGQNVA